MSGTLRSDREKPTTPGAKLKHCRPLEEFGEISMNYSDDRIGNIVYCALREWVHYQ
jgi:hypothetical protein